MSADLYAAWLTAGDRLQPAGDWIVANWWWITAVVASVFAAWAIRRSIRAARRASDRINAWLTACNGDRPEPGQPGSNDGLLDACNAIWDHTRKENQQP